MLIVVLRSGQGGGGAVGSVHAAGQHAVGDRGHLGVGDPLTSLGGDDLDDREDPSCQVGTAGGRVVVRGVVQRLYQGGHALLAPEVLAVELLQRSAREQGA